MVPKRIRYVGAIAAISWCMTAHSSPAPFGADFQAAQGAEAAPFTFATQVALTATSPLGMTNDPVGLGTDRARIASVQSAPALGLDVGAGVELTLWNFIATIRAQQDEDYFSVVQSSITSIDYTLSSPPSAVPLPAAAWLFLAGLVALAATGLSREARGSVLRLRGRARPLAT